MNPTGKFKSIWSKPECGKIKPKLVVKLKNVETIPDILVNKLANK